LPQPNYEKKQNSRKYNASFTTEEKTELPDIKANHKNTFSKRKSDKKSDIDSEYIKKESSDERVSPEKITPYLPSHDLSKNNVNSEENYIAKNSDVNNIVDLETKEAPKKKRRVENNDRSLDNIINHNIYAHALGNNNNNIKILKSENLENGNNNSLIRDRSPYDEVPSSKRRKDNVMMLLPNIKNQINYEIK